MIIQQDKDTQKAIGLEKTSDNTIRELQKAIIELESRYVVCTGYVVYGVC